MKYLLLALLFTSTALADTPAAISADYHKQAAAALVKVNGMLEKATVPLIAALVKGGDTGGATELREQLKAKTEGEPVSKPRASAAVLFASYDAARLRALEPAQKAAIARIDAVLASKDGQKLEVVTALGKVREEIETGKGTGSTSFPEIWTYHKTAESVAMADLKLIPDGTWTLVDVTSKETTLGTWKQTGDNTAELATGKVIWKLEYQGKTGVIVRPDIGIRHIKLVRK